jgi:hypothetical protein
MLFFLSYLLTFIVFSKEEGSDALVLVKDLSKVFHLLTELSLASRHALKIVLKYASILEVLGGLEEGIRGLVHSW